MHRVTKTSPVSHCYRNDVRYFHDKYSSAISANDGPRYESRQKPPHSQPMSAGRKRPIALNRPACRPVGGPRNAGLN
jgi:hypothetical protein